VMVFSALVSVGFATALVIIGHLGQRG